MASLLSLSTKAPPIGQKEDEDREAKKNKLMNFVAGIMIIPGWQAYPKNLLDYVAFCIKLLKLENITLDD